MMDMELLRGLTPGADSGRFYGVVVAIVTNHQDPEGLGRVKVRLPWLSPAQESTWARVLTPMAGPGRGLFLLPEVDDEVLVAFEHGLLDAPYVLGALWNGRDRPPESNRDGENNLRTLKSRSGHVIRLDDTRGSEKIEIVDAEGEQSLTFDTRAGTVTLRADRDVTIESKSGKLTLRGQGVEIRSGAGVEVQASRSLDLEAGVRVDVKGSVINLN